MLKYKSGLMGTILALAFATPAFSQKTPKTDTTIAKAIDTTLNDAKGDELENIPVVSLDENDNLDGSAQNISGQINSGRNPFASAAAYNWNPVRFRIRGYDADLFSTYMNGVPMENLDNGFTPYGLWGGLNDVLRSKTAAPGLQANKFSFGDIGGATNIDSRASKQRKQTNIGYAISNRNYVHRFSITHSTGFNKKGWAFSIAGSRRWADEGFTDGTFYDGWSGYIGIDKKLNSRHLLSFVAFGTPTKNGRQGASTQEMRDLAGTNYYNPYWGYQNGKKRNASVAKAFQPMGILTHEWKISPKSTLISAASYLVGNRSTTGLDWYNAADPRPDYYRYLPSYQTDSTFAAQVYNELKNDINKRQINWDALYNANYSNHETIIDAGGIAGNNVSGRRSLYIVEDRITHTNKYNVSTTFNTVINTHIDLTAGFNYENQKNHYYKKVDDLLGGEFYVDRNQFAERDFPGNYSAAQNDVDHPNRVVYVGDMFGYNYNINVQKASAWAQTTVKLRKLDFFFSAEHTYTNFWRVGHVRTGLFPNNSLGKSEEHRFYDYSVKAGTTYKLGSGNYVFANGAYQTKAPYFGDAYLAPRTRDLVQDELRSQHIATVEAGYVLVAPTVKFRATGYYTRFTHGTNILTFYSDQLHTFVNYLINNIGKEHEGVELGTEVIVAKGLTLNAAAAIGKYRYNTRQSATTTSDNSSEVLSKDVTIYSQNYYLPTPQQAYNVGFYYRSPKYWYASLNFNYFDDMWLDFDPLRRTEAAVSGVDPSSPTFHNIIDQTKLKAQYTLDFFGGYSWLMNKRFKSMGKRTFLVFNVGVSNILNNKNIVSGGYEQTRFDFAAKDSDKFPGKLFYAYGINYSASVALRF